MAISIIPKPSLIKIGDGFYQITETTAIVAPRSLHGFAGRVRDWLKPALGFELQVQSRRTPSCIELRLRKGLKNVGDEGYALTVTVDGILIEARTEAGLFYGFQTLRQLLPTDVCRSAAVRTDWSVPCVSIVDSPRFTWRGSHLDVVRHFMPKEFVLKYIDLLAMHKMNVLHLHLTDDQGWRIEIKKYPRLTEVGAVDSSDRTVIGSDGQPHKDSLAQGGFYTQDDIREIVSYAARRFITVVPEIEMPGHGQAAIAAYPELGNTGKQINVMTTYGVSEDVFNVNDSTIRFLQDVLDEVMELFPSKFIHVGGDEVPKTQWRESKDAQAKMRQLGMRDEDELQSWFIKQMDDYLTAHGRRLAGWDEILEGGFAPGATVMSWRGTTGGIAAAKAGHDVVMTPTGWTYFDHYQSRLRREEPRAIGGYLPLSKVYEFDPVPAELNKKHAKHILGAQCQLWSEYIPHPRHMEYMAFPRLCALAEVVWSGDADRTYEEFLGRLETHLERLRILDVNYRPLGDLLAEPVATWRKGDISNDFAVTVKDISAHINGAAGYKAFVSYSGGMVGVVIQFVELLENGVCVSRDEHIGKSGNADQDNEYLLTLDSYSANAKYELRLSMKGDGGTDTSADLFIFPSDPAR